jgi:hypothetical protein
LLDNLPPRFLSSKPNQIVKKDVEVEEGDPLLPPGIENQAERKYINLGKRVDDKLLATRMPWYRKSLCTREKIVLDFVYLEWQCWALKGVSERIGLLVKAKEGPIDDRRTEGKKSQPKTPLAVS